jgi:hypothetical protein
MDHGCDGTRKAWSIESALHTIFRSRNRLISGRSSVSLTAMKHRPSLPLVVLALLLAPLGGCRSLRDGTDRGGRILDLPGPRPVKVVAMLGSLPGLAIAVPITILLMPTLPFQSDPDLTYTSSPEHDIRMPIVNAPCEYGSGLGAFILSSPFLLGNSRLGAYGEPSEWPPAREWRGPEASPGRVVWTERDGWKEPPPVPKAEGPPAAGTPAPAPAEAPKQMAP